MLDEEINIMYVSECECVCVCGGLVGYPKPITPKEIKNEQDKE